MPVALISTSTSPGFGPSMSMVSMLKGSPAFQATAARDFMNLAPCSRYPVAIAAELKVAQVSICNADHGGRVMLKTPLCDVLGIDLPIILAPMGSCTSAELAAAVS